MKIKTLVSSLHWVSGEIFKVNNEDEKYYYFESDGCQCAVLKDSECEVIPQSITEWMVDEKIANHGIQAGHIKDGLKLEGLPREEQEARCRLYRAWRTKTDKKNDIPSWQAYQLAIAGIDPRDVLERQIDMKIDAQNNE